ncbi:MAG: caspase family protein, partial [Pseudomonadota bacterium]
SLGKLKAENVYVFLDACFSGAAGRSEEQKLLFEGARPGLIKIKDPALTQDNLIVFSATGANQVSNAYPEMEHGLFTYFLLKGLGGEGTQKQAGLIRVDDLATYVRTNVDNTSRRIFGKNLLQTPVAKWGRGREDTIIVKTP